MYVSLIFMTTDIDRTLEDRIILQDYKKLKLVAQLCLTLCNTMDCSPPGFSAHGDSPGKNTGVGSIPF